MSKTGLSNFYWNSNLKKNGAYKNRFDKPFIEEINGTQPHQRHLVDGFVINSSF